MCISVKRLATRTTLFVINGSGEPSIEHVRIEVDPEHKLAVLEHLNAHRGKLQTWEHLRVRVGCAAGLLSTTR